MSIMTDREAALLSEAKKLDISPSKYQQALERFKAMKDCLEGGEYDGCIKSPEVFLQGSFKLGTEIRPYKGCKDADYDIDLVCRLDRRKSVSTATKVKNLVGDRLKSHGTYGPMLDTEGKRCWTINYAEADGVGFHMDILPAVSEENITLLAYDLYRDSLAITDKNKDTREYAWKPSNPKGFAKWFYSKNKVMFDRVKDSSKRAVFENYRADKTGGIYQRMDDVPDIFVKTPLQRAIQLLKRHRDIRFAGLKNEACKPISMVISVLAAQIYRNESSIYETLKSIVSVLDRHAQQLEATYRFDEDLSRSAYNLITLKVDGEWYIPNPSHDDENFADRWHLEEYGVKHARAVAFFDWVKWAKQDFINIAERLDEGYFQGKLYPQRSGGAPSASGGSGTAVSLFNVKHRQRPEDKWPINTGLFSANISASYNRDGWHVLPDQSTNYLIENGAIVPTQKRICFKATTNARPPYEVHWQVVNTGDEARNAGCLRGDFYKSSGDCSIIQGKKTRVEPTAYNGDHWVQCFIVKDSVCVAMSEPFIVRVRR